MSYFKKQDGSSYILNIIKGTLIGLLLTFLLIIIFTIILAYTKLSEGLIPFINSIIMILGISSGAILTSKKLDKRGWVNGGLIGICYFLIIFVISQILIKDFSLGKYFFIKGSIALVTGCIGGMIGINIK
ncbi:MAG: TIGR04086 family membrane protein [Tissierellales bacterium]